jgi:hypothetical protein
MYDHVTRRVVVQFVFHQIGKSQTITSSRFAPQTHFQTTATGDSEFLEALGIMVAAGSITVASAYLGLC